MQNGKTDPTNKQILTVFQFQKIDSRNLVYCMFVTSQPD